MATTDDATDATAQPSDEHEAETFDAPITIEASGPAVLERHFEDETSFGVVETETTVDITIPFQTVEAVLDAFFKDKFGANTLEHGMEHAPKAEMHDIITDELTEMHCRTIDYHDGEWDVELDGPVTAWIAVFEKCTDPHSAAKSLVMHDVIGDGVRLAAQEFDRRG